MRKMLRLIFNTTILSAFAFLIAGFPLIVSAQAPKREFRSVWLTTVLGLDWPPSGVSAAQQEQALREIIRKSEAMGMNAIVFQVVSRGDAMYPSERLPWAPWLTGMPGVDPGWDPLAVAIEECHKLGIELHAWYNVYRIGDASTPVSSTAQPLHVRFAHAEWVETVGNDYWINPAFPELRDWLVDNVREIATKYDIDAIHFDYIRTSTGGYTRDNELMQLYNPDNIQDISEWRRENINKFVRAVYAAVKATKPWVKVGSTPIGHYKQTSEMNWSALWGYKDVFQDSRRWLQEQVHDYLAPQIYWAIGQTTDAPRFEILTRDWANENYGRHVYIGMAPYKTNVFTELPIEIDTTRAAGAHGQLQFRYGFINTQPPPFGDRYRYKAFPPVMVWQDSVKPSAPANLRYEPILASGPPVLRWNLPSAGSNGDSSLRHSIYRFVTMSPQQSDFDNPINILSLTGDTSFTALAPPTSGPWYYAVSSLDRTYNESEASNIISITPPPSPVLATPPDGTVDQSDSIVFKWNTSPLTVFYQLQISADSTFSSAFVVNMLDLVDTVKLVTGFAGQQQYFWRVAAANAGGAGSFSSHRVFTTGSPATVALALPANSSDNVSIHPTLAWRSSQGANTYRVQVSTSFDFSTIVKDTTGVQDTSVALTGLQGNKIHSWRVNATNSVGTSLWSEVWRFRTETPVAVSEENEIPRKYELSQNYPNPFNPVTRIQVAVPQPGYLTLRVYDILGREVTTLVDYELIPGIHTFRFDGSKLPSGTYFYVLMTSDARIVKKMMLLK